jgi:alanine racemase
MKHAQLRISKSNLLHNFNFYKSKIDKETKIMVLVKANGYGLGDIEIATLVQEFGAHYLGVAFPCEGIRLKKAGIKLPVMILTPGVNNFKEIVEYGLEPSIINEHSFRAVAAEVRKAGISNYPVHIKIDTGMQRVGFTPEEAPLVKELIKDNPHLHIKSVFSHLAAADEKAHDQFTQEQISRYKDTYSIICENIDYKPIRHILNSAGTERFPDACMDMVRIGIGLYGSSYAGEINLRPVASFVAPVAHIKEVKDGSSVGYGRKGVVDGSVRKIATIPVGYADGVNRLLSRGNIEFILNGKKVPTIGNVCMDSFMVDITECEARLGDELTIFGEDPSALTLAEKLNTITYEIFTSVSARVERVVI